MIGRTRAMIGLLLFATAVAVMPASSAAQALLWSRVAYGAGGASDSRPGSGNQELGNRSIAVDASGNAIVTGWSHNGSSIDFRTIKYAAADGSVVWERSFNGAGNGEDGAYAVALDGSGNAIVTGYTHNGSNYDFKTIKYAAADGAVVWEKTFNSAANREDRPSAVAVDAAGNAVVTGYIFDGSQYDFKTIKYAAADGAVMWEKTFNGAANSFDYAYAVAVDTAGNAIVTGHSWNGSNYDFKTLKYAAADGAVMWEKTFGGAANNHDYAKAVAVDAAGNAIVTGYSWNGSNDDFKTLKYAASDGAVMWEKTFNGAANGFDRAYAVAVDAAGNAVVTGYSHNGSNSDFKTIKYAAADGAVMWEKIFNGPANHEDYTYALAVDASGNVIVAGNSYSVGSSTDFKTIKYGATDGAVIWEKTYNGAANFEDQAFAVAVDASGNAIVTGYIRNGSNYDFKTLKYSAADGAMAWEGAAGSSPLYARVAPTEGQGKFAIARDASGNAFVTGYSWNGSSEDFRTIKYAAADGAVVWEKTFNGAANGTDQAYAVAVDAAGNAIVTGYSYNGSNSDFKTIKYAAADGAVMWEKTFNGAANGFDFAYAVAVDTAGNAIVTGYSYNGSNNNFKTLKYAAADGAVMWETLNGAANSLAFAVATDASGNAIVTGYSYNGSSLDFKTIKYGAADGAVVWEKTFNGAANGTDQAYAVAVDASGNAIVTGISHNGSNTDFKTIKYAAADGAVAWEKTFNGTANNTDQAYAVAVDASGNAIVTGYSWNGSSYDFKTIKYAAADGAVMWEKSFNGAANSHDQAFAVAADASGNAIVTGRSWNGSNWNFMTVKHAAGDGALLWEHTFDGSVSGADEAVGLVAAPGAVYVVGNCLNGGPQAICTLRISNKSAAVANLIGPASSSYGQSATFDASGSYAVDSSSLSGGTFTFRDGTAVLCSGTANTCTISTLAVGSHSITVTFEGNSLVDPATSAPLAHTVNQIPQSITFAALPDRNIGQGPFTLTATGGASGNPVTFASSTTGICSTTGTDGATLTLVTLGTCTVTASQAGNINYAAATPVPRSFEVREGTAPDTVISSTPPTVTNSTAASFTFGGSDTGGSGLASFSCSLDAAPFTTCTSPQSYTSLAAGAHTFAVRAHDGAGNVDPTPASHAWTIDLTPPTVTLDPPLPITAANQASYKVSGACSEAGRNVTVAAGSVNATVTCGAGGFTSSLNVTSLPDGAVALSAATTDAAGNNAAANATVAKDTAAHERAESDFNADGKSDMLWRNASTGNVYRMLMNGTTTVHGAFVWAEPNLDWTVIADADFNGDGISDLLWRNASSGQVFMALFGPSGSAVNSAFVYTEPNAAWKIVHTPDLDGDGRADIVWWNSTTGQVYAMLMNGFGIVAQGQVYTEPNTAWKIVTVGDFVDSGKRNQLLWRNATTGQVTMMTVSYASGSFATTAPAPVYQEPNTAWKIIAGADFNGDGKTDILWRNESTGRIYAMLMNGTAIASQGTMYMEPNLAWKIVATGDYNGDGKADLLWRNDTTGQVYLVQMNGLGITAQGMVYQEPNTAWRLLGAWEYGQATGTLGP